MAMPQNGRKKGATPQDEGSSVAYVRSIDHSPLM
jgi:hypothetical protein